MTQSLADALAEISDPEMIEQLLSGIDESDNTQSSSPSSASSQSTLSKLYERFLRRRQNRSPATISNYKRTLPGFVQFAASRHALYPGEITTELVDAYVDSLLQEYDSDATILLHTSNVRPWLKWLNKRELCREAVYHILDKDELGLSPNAREEALPEKEATAILEALREQQYGSNLHALLELLWNTGIRIGEIRALDLGDINQADNDLAVRHRPDEATRIKNGRAGDATNGDGERDLNIHPHVVDVLSAYINLNRPETTDGFGRDPLFTTAHGRPARSTLRRWVYEATSCRWVDPELTERSCDGSCDPDSNVCAHSYYPHAVRRGAIVTHLSNDLRPDKAAERFDVSTDVIRKHYDPRSKARRKNDRADAVKDAWSDL